MCRQVLKKAIWMLECIGLNPLKRGVFSMIRLYVLIAFFITVNIFTYSELILNYRGFTTIIRAADSYSSVYQGMWKTFVLISKRRSLRKALTKTERFWSVQAFGEEHEKELDRATNLAVKFYNSFLTMGVTVAFQFFMTPLFMGKGELPMICFNETKGYSRSVYVALYSFFIIYAPPIFFVMLGFDGLFLYLFWQGYTEMKMVKIAFSKEDLRTANGKRSRFVSAVKHHHFVLSYINDLTNIFSSLLLNQVISSTCLLCFSLTMMTMDGIPPDIHHISKHVPFMFAFIVQLLMYCVLGQILTEAGLDIGDEIFYIDWMDKESYKNKLDKMMVIRRSQKPQIISVGGYYALNLTSFMLVIKNGVSLFTFMQALNKE